MINSKKILQLVHTGRYLKVRQIIYRGIYHFHKCSGIIQLVTPTIRSWLHPWNAPTPFSSYINELGEFNFLNETGAVTTAEDWNNPESSKLWLYNLHYFDELNTINARERQDDLNQLINRWILENPVMQGNGWEPYPLSLRIVNFVKWFSQSPGTVNKACLDSLALQAEMLLKQREYHLLGNHLFANGKALVFVGVFLAGPRANIWLKKGLKILDKEIKEQFLADGAHFELSPMYHATLLWDMLDLLNLSYCANLTELNHRRSAWEQVIRRGLSWLYSMLHPDNKISFFNDAAFGIAPESIELVNYAKRFDILLPQAKPVFSLEWLSSSGYCAVNLGSQCKAIIDIAAIGPDYLPGHAHADTLSFELSLFGQRFLVNSGTSQYGTDTQRLYERSTRAHNTISLDGENSSEVWAGFRVARRAYPGNRTIKHEQETILIAAEHDGYKRLPGKNIHRREWLFSQKKLILTDFIQGAYDNAVSRLYFHPAVQVRIIEQHTIECQLLNQQKVLIKLYGDCQIHLEDTFWYPEFGVKKENCCLIVQFKGSKLITEMGW